MSAQFVSIPVSEFEALARAARELRRLAERDFNHDGFGRSEPVDEADCRLCQVLARVPLGVEEGDPQPVENP